MRENKRKFRPDRKLMKPGTLPVFLSPYYQETWGVSLVVALVVMEPLGRRLLSAQQSALKKVLHIAPSVGNKIDENFFTIHTVNDPVRLEENFPKFANPYRYEFFRICSTLGLFGEAVKFSLYSVQDMLRFPE
jgi:hypothetical protein